MSDYDEVLLEDFESFLRAALYQAEEALDVATSLGQDFSKEKYDLLGVIDTLNEIIDEL